MLLYAGESSMKRMEAVSSAGRISVTLGLVATQDVADQ